MSFGGGVDKFLGLHLTQVHGKIFMCNFIQEYQLTKKPKLGQFKYKNYPLA